MKTLLMTGLDRRLVLRAKVGVDTSPVLTVRAEGVEVGGLPFPLGLPPRLIGAGLAFAVCERGLLLSPSFLGGQRSRMIEDVLENGQVAAGHQVIRREAAAAGEKQTDEQDRGSRHAGILVPST